jgi:hypothetical protein
MKWAWENGFFGGCVISYRQMGEQAGADRQRNSERDRAGKIVVKNAGTRYEFDYNQIQAFWRCRNPPCQKAARL